MKILKKTLVFTMVFVLMQNVFACKNKNGEVSSNNFCTIKIDCSTILDNMENLNPEKTSLVPDDGIILNLENIAFEQGETALDIVKRVLQSEKIHFDVQGATAQSGSYVKGINNIYSADCGELSGWMYAVNGEYADTDCGSYKVQNGDVIEFNYTCDMGADLGVTY